MSKDRRTKKYEYGNNDKQYIVLLPYLIAVSLIIYALLGYKITDTASVIKLVVGVCVVYYLIKIILYLIKRHRLGNADIHTIDKMKGTEFEKHLAKIFKQRGYKAVLTKKSRDKGADLIVTDKNGITCAVQAKRYKYKVGIEAVQQVLAAKEYYETDAAMVITNSYFTPDAIDMAKKTNVALINRSELEKAWTFKKERKTKTKAKRVTARTERA